jgi:hypothetical protein
MTDRSGVLFSTLWYRVCYCLIPPTSLRTPVRWRNRRGGGWRSLSREEVQKLQSLAGSGSAPIFTSGHYTVGDGGGGGVQMNHNNNKNKKYYICFLLINLLTVLHFVFLKVSQYPCTSDIPPPSRKGNLPSCYILYILSGSLKEA